MLPGVIAENSKDDQRHLVQKMVNDGEPLHAQGQADEMAVGLLLDVRAGLVTARHHRLVDFRQLPLFTLLLRQLLDIAFHEAGIVDVPGHLVQGILRTPVDVLQRRDVHVLVDKLVAVVPQHIERDAVQQLNLPTEHVGSLTDSTLKDVALQNGHHTALILLAVVERHMRFADRTIVNHRYIESIFDDNALIITGAYVKQARPTAENEKYIENKHVKYNRYNKESYLKQLITIFGSNEYVNIRFADNDIQKMGTGGELYGGNFD